MTKSRRLPAFLLTVGLALAKSIPAQETSCEPPARPRNAAPMFFDLEREADLGDAVHEHLQSGFRQVDDETLVAYLSRVGERVRPYIPGANPRIRFYLSDAPFIQAMSFIGSRIYVTRKLAVFVRSEDELAAVLAHEIAHDANRDVAQAFNRRLRALGVSRITDRRDAFDKYNLLLDSAKRDPKDARQGEDEQEQIAADRLAVHAIVRAGYRPQAMAEFWDRLAETRGQTGSWLSDFFGATGPERKRLREVLKAEIALSANCIDQRGIDAPAFAQWQSAIKAYESEKRKEVLPGLVFRKELEQPLQPALDHLAFSPDGRFLLAQDDAGINVLSREPFHPLFRIDAPDARRAHFTPDSSAIVFPTSTLRIEKWSVVSQERVLLSEIVRPKPCSASLLSPDGSTLACQDSDGALLLLDVASGLESFRKDSFAPRDTEVSPLMRAMMGAATDLVFSPDSRYLLAVVGRKTMAYDLVEKRPVPIGGHLDDLLWSGSGVAFIDSNRVAGVEGFARNLEVVRFPDGKVLSSTKFVGRGRISAAAAGEAILMKPAGNYAVALISVTTGKTLAASFGPALDVFNDLFVSEIGDGQIDLRQLKVGEKSLRIAVSPLLPSPLGALFAAALSADSKWLAMSERFRGAVWNLESRKRVALMRSFAGGYFDAATAALHADFPAFRDQPRVVGKLDLATAKIVDARVVDASASVIQLGSGMLTIQRDAKQREVATLEMNDVRSNERLWSRKIEGGTPTLIPITDGDIVLAWPTKDPAAQRQIAGNPLLAPRLPSLARKEGEFLLEVIAARTGLTTGSFVFDRGEGLSYISRVHAAGSVLAIEDNLGRVLIYSLADGQLRQRLFAQHATLSASGALLAAENTPGRLAVYDLATNERKLELSFAHPLAAGRFVDDRRILVVTADQAVYLVDVGLTRDK